MAKPTYVSPEERAHIVALFREHPSIDRVSQEMSGIVGAHRIRRILIEEGEYDPKKMIRGRTLSDSIEITRHVRNAWRDGVTMREISEDYGIAEPTVQRLVKDIKRPRGPRFLRKPSGDIPSDPLVLAWLAGVFDASANIGLESRPGAPIPFIHIYGVPSFANLVHKTAGCGVLNAPSKQRGGMRWRWTCIAKSDTVELLRRVEPYLKDRKTIVRRILVKCAPITEFIDKETTA